MKTLTITEGRGRLDFWLKKAIAGEDIGFEIASCIQGEKGTFNFRLRGEP